MKTAIIIHGYNDKSEKGVSHLYLPLRIYPENRHLQLSCENGVSHLQPLIFEARKC